MTPGQCSLFVCQPVRRDRETETEKVTETDTEKETDRDGDKERSRQAKEQTDVQTDDHSETRKQGGRRTRQLGKPTEGQMDWHAASGRHTEPGLELSELDDIQISLSIHNCLC